MPWPGDVRVGFIGVTEIQSNEHICPLGFYCGILGNTLCCPAYLHCSLSSTETLGVQSEKLGPKLVED